MLMSTNPKSDYNKMKENVVNLTTFISGGIFLRIAFGMFQYLSCSVIG